MSEFTCHSYGDIGIHGDLDLYEVVEEAELSAPVTHVTELDVYKILLNSLEERIRNKEDIAAIELRVDMPWLKQRIKQLQG
jgi:hypothetical protein